MSEIVSVLLIGVSLSMDTFSASLPIGMLKDNKILLIPYIVGLFHFIMPLLGNIIGTNIIYYFQIASSILLGLLLIIIAITMLINFFKEDESTINISIIGIVIFAFSVSIDSFTVGLGISNITNNHCLAALIFSICSFSFTYFGLLIGKYSKKYIGNYAILLGVITLLVLGLYHIF